MIELFIASFKSLSLKRIAILLILLTLTIQSKSDPNKITWSGNLQFTEDGWLHPKDISDVMKEIKMVEVDCGNVCDTTRKESKKVRTGQYGIDELTKDVDCDSLFESSFLDGINPKSKGHVGGSAPRLTDLPEETLNKWTFDGVIPKLIFHVDNQSCPWRDQGPSQSWGLGDFQSLYGNLWKNGKKEYLWRVKLIDTLRGIYRRGLLFKPEQGRAMNEKSQFCGSLITYNKITSNSSETWNQVPGFRDFVDEYFRNGYGFGLHSSIHAMEFEEHLKQHVLNKKDSEEGHNVKNVLVIGSKMPWVEAILLELGVEKVTSLVTNPEVTRSEHENITVISFSDLSEMWSEGKFNDEKNKFDAVIAYNSLGQWHGIGGFGHPGYRVINPWADVLTLSKAWCISKKQSRALVALPMTKNFDDLVVFNSGKFYGRLQLAHLFTNWKQVPEDYNYYETMKKFVWENKEQTNEELEGTEACHKNDINCSSEETKIKTSKVKGPSQPVAADEPKSYLPIYIIQRP